MLFHTTFLITTFGLKDRLNVVYVITVITAPESGNVIQRPGFWRSFIGEKRVFLGEFVESRRSMRICTGVSRTRAETLQTQSFIFLLIKNISATKVI